MKTLLILALASFAALNQTAQASSANAVAATLKLLNDPTNPTRKEILDARSFNCFSQDEICREYAEQADSNKYTFTKSDIVAVVYLGEGANEQPCKTDECHGVDEETKNYTILVKSIVSARWGYSPATVFLGVEFVKETAQFDGKVRNYVRLATIQNQAPVKE